ncbi:MAG: hypothetical protein LBQ66_00415 [Planctomycetaceae bacterium]|nr:hypothetical protein [Planctomycetaceae bacterium]
MTENFEDKLEEKLLDILESPKSVQTETGMVTNRDASDVIAAAKYIRQVRAEQSVLQAKKFPLNLIKIEPK